MGAQGTVSPFRNSLQDTINYVKISPDELLKNRLKYFFYVDGRLLWLRIK